MRLDRTLIIAPHPDDDIIAAGGLIQRVLAASGDIHVLYVTDGEDNSWPQRWTHQRWAISDAERKAWGEMRREEARCALTRLGAHAATTTFLALPDRKIATLVRRGDSRLLQTLRRIVADFQPTLIVSSSSRDLHSDHRAVAWSAHAVTTGDTEIVTYVVHGEAIERRIECRMDLTAQEQATKRAAIECHRSQLLLSRDRFLSYAKAGETFYRAEFDLIGVESTARERVAMLRQAVRAMFGTHATR